MRFFVSVTSVFQAPHANEFPVNLRWCEHPARGITKGVVWTCPGNCIFIFLTNLSNEWPRSHFVWRSKETAFSSCEFHCTIKHFMIKLSWTVWMRTRGSVNSTKGRCSCLALGDSSSIYSSCLFKSINLPHFQLPLSKLRKSFLRLLNWKWHQQTKASAFGRDTSR